MKISNSPMRNWFRFYNSAGVFFRVWLMKRHSGEPSENDNRVDSAIVGTAKAG